MAIFSIEQGIREIDLEESLDPINRWNPASTPARRSYAEAFVFAKENDSEELEYAVVKENNVYSIVYRVKE